MDVKPKIKRNPYVTHERIVFEARSGLYDIVDTWLTDATLAWMLSVMKAAIYFAEQGKHRYSAKIN